MKLNKLTQLTALSMTLLGASTFAASNDALLDLLVKKGVLSSTEATTVAAELKEADKGISFSAKGKETVKLRFNGRMQAQYDSLAGTLNGTDTSSTNHFYFRRLFLGAKATLSNGIYAETVLDFAGDENPEIAFDKASFGYKFDDAFDAQLGFQKVPFGFEETESSSSLPTIERSAANRFFADQIDFSSRHMGIHANGELGGGFGYAAAVVNGAQGEGSKLGGAAQNENDMAYYGRIQWKNDNFTVGVDAGVQSNSSKVDDDVTAFTGYVNYKLDGLDLLAEYYSADLGGTNGDVDAYALRASYRINKWEPVIRYAHVESDGFDIDADELIRRAHTDLDNNTDTELESFYFGANYYFSKAVTFMAGYEIAEATSDTAGQKSEIDGFRARVQVLW
jgi:phosphate-selective porin